MQKQKVACMTAAGFLGILLVTATATPAFSQSRGVVVEAPRVDPALQRKVFYHDLNLAQSRDQRLLRNRIYQTAQSLCFDINLVREETCPSSAVQSTSGQVKAAIKRAELRMAGLPAGPNVAITMAITGL